jgi:hypothetical protein
MMLVYRIVVAWGHFASGRRTETTTHGFGDTLLIQSKQYLSCNFLLSIRNNVIRVKRGPRLGVQANQ